MLLGDGDAPEFVQLVNPFGADSALSANNGTTTRGKEYR
jgi:hypothetical protein